VITIIHLTIDLAPITKKNHQRIIRIGGVPRIIQSKEYLAYERQAISQIKQRYAVETIISPVNVAAVFYMPTRRRVDLVNLQEALLDILVRAEVLEDDNSRIVVSMDGSRVSYDKHHPRTEVSITGGGEI